MRRERREREARAKQIEEDDANAEDIERKSFADMAGSSRQNEPSRNSDSQSETQTHELGVSPQLKEVLLAAEKLASQYGEHLDACMYCMGWFQLCSVVLPIFVWHMKSFNT